MMQPGTLAKVRSTNEVVEVVRVDDQRKLATVRCRTGRFAIRVYLLRDLAPVDAWAIA